MPRVMVSITKRLKFQGHDEEFSNVYRYEVTSADDYDAMVALVRAVRAAEGPVHSAAVSFIRGNAWDVGLAPNKMIVSEDFSGVGTGPGNFDIYRECAVLVQWPLDRRVGLRLTRHRSLKKWLHCAQLNFGAGVTGNGLLEAGEKARFITYANAVADGLPNGAQLVAPNGNRPSEPPRVHDYLEHRQFPKGRKERIV